LFVKLCRCSIKNWIKHNGETDECSEFIWIKRSFKQDEIVSLCLNERSAFIFEKLEYDITLEYKNSGNNDFLNFVILMMDYEFKIWSFPIILEM
jgi:hypothetical protein